MKAKSSMSTPIEKIMLEDSKWNIISLKFHHHFKKLTKGDKELLNETKAMIHKHKQKTIKDKIIPDVLDKYPQKLIKRVYI